MTPLQALVEPARRRLFEALHLSPDAALTVDEASRLLKRDRTVAFDHLETLRSAGLVTADEVRSGGRGRPAHLYRLKRPDAIDLSIPQRRNGKLAAAFARALVESGPGMTELAHEQGRQIGLQLLAGARTANRRLEILRDFGGDYDINRTEIHARNCVFVEACVTEPPVACHAHAGMLEVVINAEQKGLDVFPAGSDGRGGCRYRISAAASKAGRRRRSTTGGHENAGATEPRR